MPVLDTIVRLAEAYEAGKTKPANPYKKLEFEVVDLELEISDKVVWKQTEDGVIYCASCIKEDSVKPGCRLVAMDDEECSFKTVEEFQKKMADLGEGFVLEFKTPMDKYIKIYKKVKKKKDDIDDWVAWDTWFFKTQTPEAKMNR
eukprot:UN04238